MTDLGILRWIAGKMLRLPPRRSRRICAVKDVPVAMRDGVVLLADRYYPRDMPSAPVVLMRSPYGRGAILGFIAALVAERGFQVVVQAVRGTAGSGGDFDPMRQERADGVDTLAWLGAQPWYSGRTFTFGPSYLGNVQWAMASEAPDSLHGLALLVTLSNFRDELRAFGGLTQGGVLGWSQMMVGMIHAVPGQRFKRPDARALERAQSHLPLATIDQAAIGRTVPWWQNWIAHDPDDSWWDAFDHSAAVTALAAPTTMIGGWQDIFLLYQVRDFEARQAAGRDAWLTIGPWTHSAVGGMIEGMRQAVALFSAIDEGRPPFAGRDRVRVYLQGAAQWRDYPAWPPPGATPLALHLRGGGALNPSAPDAGEAATTYVYDPADPTPALHGPKIMGNARVRDMRALEARGDTISFTAAPLDRDLDVIGPVTVELSVRSDRAHTDFFACLCDVDRNGRPLQVSDGYLRLTPGKPEADATGVRRITIACWPTAYRFKRGHRIRLIVASGAHPRYARNLGTGEPIATATDMVPAHQQILHDADHPSCVILSTV